MLPYLRRVAIEEGVPEVHQGEGKVLIEEVAEELAHPDVGPAPMYQQQSLQVSELSEWVVARHDGLHALLSTDSDPNVGSCE